jgi:hypothetical protein
MIPINPVPNVTKPNTTARKIGKATSLFPGLLDLLDAYSSEKNETTKAPIAYSIHPHHGRSAGLMHPLSFLSLMYYCYLRGVEKINLVGN